MHINVSQLMREPSGSTRSVEVDESVSFALNLDRSRVQGTVGLTRTDRGIWVRAFLDSTARCVCSRCLDDLEQPVRLTIDEEFLPVEESSLAADHIEGNHIDQDQILNLTEAVRQYFAIGVPMNPVCSSECLGLCLKCGANLNETPCNCDTVDRDSRWGALLELTSARDNSR